MNIHFKSRETRLGIIVILLIMIGLGVYVFYISFEKSLDSARTDIEVRENADVIVDYTPPPVPQLNPTDYIRMGGKDREVGKVPTLKEYYSRRISPGAPPYVPHPIPPRSEELPLQEPGNCLTCHLNGGYVPKWDRYVSVTPHPEYGEMNCRTCHLEMAGQPKGKQTWFKKVATPGIPPAIPHELIYRTNCMACHATGAPTELRTPHPERGNCQICHLPEAAQ